MAGGGGSRAPSILARLRPLADELGKGRDVEVVWECPASLPTIETDPLCLEQILTNLLTNALKFTAHGRGSTFTVDLPLRFHTVATASAA